MQVTGFIFNFGIVSQRLIILCVSIYLLLLVVKEQRLRHLESGFHIFIWVTALVDSFVPLGANAYGDATDWCWIKNGTRQIEMYRFGCYYIPMVVFLAVEIVIYSLIIIKVRKEFVGADTIDPERYAWYKKYIKPLYYFPLVNILLAIPTTACRIQQFVDKHNPNCTLTVMHSIIFPIWGLVYSLMFLLDKDTRRLLLPNILCRDIYNASISVVSNSRRSDANPFNGENGQPPSLDDYAIENPLIDERSHFPQVTADMTTGVYNTKPE